MKPSILKAIVVTAELTGTELLVALRVMAGDLDAYPEAAVCVRSTAAAES